MRDATLFAGASNELSWCHPATSDTQIITFLRCGATESGTDLHAHPNHVIWGRGGFDKDAFLATGERTLNLIVDPTTAYLVADALESARTGSSGSAHDQIECAEDRLADQDR